jgi:hypothetical protein
MLFPSALLRQNVPPVGFSGMMSVAISLKGKLGLLMRAGWKKLVGRSVCDFYWATDPSGFLNIEKIKVHSNMTDNGSV